jgi:hypothetical protein
MKKNLFHPFILSFSVILVLTPLLQATDVTGDNLILTGDADIAGSNLSLGTSGSDPGLTFSHNNTTATISITSSQEAAKWEWKRTPSGGAVISMRLDASNQLILYNLAGTTAGITLNPAGTSAFVNGITIGGSAVLTSAAAAATYLTPATADTAYVKTNLTKLALGTSATAVANETFAIGNHANATGTYGIALGAYTTASGSNALALGSGVLASGINSIALGGYTIASNNYSIAMGFTTTASGELSTAIGDRTVAQGYAQFVVGRVNTPQGNASTWVSTDDLFIVGNGTTGSPSNAFVVKKNGDTTVNGGVRVVTDDTAGYGVTIGSGTVSDGGNLRLLSSTNHWNMDNSGGSLRFFTESNYGTNTVVRASINSSGDMNLTGKLSVAGALRVPPQGDISMGDFTAEP